MGAGHLSAERRIGAQKTFCKMTFKRRGKIRRSKVILQNDSRAQNLEITAALYLSADRGIGYYYLSIIEYDLTWAVYQLAVILFHFFYSNIEYASCFKINEEIVWAKIILFLFIHLLMTQFPFTLQLFM